MAYEQHRNVLERARQFTQGTNLGADYTGDEIEFMLAMDRWKRSNRCPYPTCADVLAVAKSLGYRKDVQRG